MWPATLPGLGFGTSNILHFTNSREATKGLEAVYDAGITYFDTAPLYGYGWAETLVGQFAQGKRHEITIATKAGLEPGLVKSLIPFNLLTSARTWVKAIRSKEHNSDPIPTLIPQHTSLCAEMLGRSLERSLRQLKTDYVDILLLHEATVMYANQEAVLQFANDAITSGKVRAMGLGSAPGALQQIEHLDPIYKVIQSDFSWDSSWASTPSISLSNVYALLREVKRLNTLSANDTVKKGILALTGLDVQSKQDVLRFVMASSATLYPNGITLFSSTHTQHIREITDIWHADKLPASQWMEAIRFIRTQMR